MSDALSSWRQGRRFVLDYVIREWMGLLVVVLASVIYLCLVPGHVVGGDNGEFVALSRMDGVAHPPGYPLYTLYLRSFSWLPFSAAKSASVATALLGSLQLIALYLACRSWQVSPLASSISVAYYASSGIAMALNTHAEVFALNNLLAAIFLFLASRACSSPSLVFCGNCFLCGIGLSHHHSIVLIAPLVACTSLQSWMRIHRGMRRRASLLAASAFLIGLAPNLLLIAWSYARRSNQFSWGEIDGLGALFHHFLRRDYGTFNLSAGKGKVDVAGQEFLLMQSFYWAWNVLLPFSAIGFFLSIKRFLGSRPVEFWRWISLLLSLLLAGPVFVMRFNIAIVPPGPALVERFHFLPVLLLVIPVAKGLEYSVHILRRLIPAKSGRLDASRMLKAVVSGTVLIFSFYFNGSIGCARYRDRSNRLIHDTLVHALESLPRGSMLFVTADHKVFGYMYLNGVVGLRRDVQVVSPALLKYHWYRKRLGLAAANYDLAVLELMRRGSRYRQPVFVDGFMASRLPHLDHYQYGLFRRIVRRSDRLPSPDGLIVDNERIFSGFASLKGSHSIGDGWSMVVENEKISAWHGLASDLAKIGRKDLADRALKNAENY